MLRRRCLGDAQYERVYMGSIALSKCSVSLAVRYQVTGIDESEMILEQAIDLV